MDQGKQLTSYFVTRHPGAIEWANGQGIAVDQCIPHLDPEIVRPGDVVIGILPVNLAAEVCTRGGKFFNLSLDTPVEARGKELDAEELERYGARIEEYLVRRVVAE